MTSLDFGELPETVADPVRKLELLSAGDALGMHFEPVSWIIPGLIPEGEYGLLHGPSGCGKSYWLLQMMADMGYANRPLVGNPEWLVPEPVKTLYVSYEDSLRQIVGRLKAHQGKYVAENCSYDNLKLKALRDESGNTRLLNSEGEVTGFISDLIETIKAEGDIKVVAIDTLRSGIDCDEENTAYTLLVNALRKAIKETGASFIVVHHNSKAGTSSGGGVLAARGGVSLTDSARFVLGVSDVGSDYKTAGHEASSIHQQGLQVSGCREVNRRSIWR